MVVKGGKHGGPFGRLRGAEPGRLPLGSRCLSGFFLLFVVLLVVLGPAGAGARSASSSAPVFYAAGESLYRLDGAGRVAEVAKLPGEAVAVAVNPKGGSVSVLMGRRLYGYDDSGNRVSEKDLDIGAPSRGAPSPLAIDPRDGTIWAGSDDALLRLDTSGETMGSTQLQDGPARAVALAADGSAWVLGAGYLSRVSKDGEVLSEEDPAEHVAEPEYLALDELGGFAYLANKDEVARLDLEDGRPTGKRIQPGDKVEGGIAVDPVSGMLYVGGRGALYAYGRNGESKGKVSSEPSGTGTAKRPEALGAAPLYLSSRLSIVEPGEDALTNDARPEVKLGVETTCNGGLCPKDAELPGEEPRIEATLNGRDVGDFFRFEGGEASYTPEEDLPEGTNTLTAEAIDPSGHRSERLTSSFTVDTTPPRFEDVEPADGDTVEESEVAITGKVDDPEASLLFDEPGSTAKNTDGGEFEYEVPLKEGENAFKVTATDKAGNVGEQEIRLTRRTSKDTSAGSPEEEPEQTDSPETDASPEATTPATDPSAEASGAGVEPPERTDAAPKREEAGLVRPVRETDEPEIEPEPVPGGTIGRDKVTIKGSVEGPSSMEVRAGEAKAEVRGSVFAARDVPLGEGPNTIAVTATTPDGKRAEETFEVTYEPPFEEKVAQVESGSAATQANTPGATITVNSTEDIVDANPGDGACETASGTGVCTLRAAVQESNASNGQDTV